MVQDFGILDWMKKMDTGNFNAFHLIIREYFRLSDLKRERFEARDFDISII